MEKNDELEQLTDIFATCGRCRAPVCASLDTVTEAERVVIFAYNLASPGFYSFDSTFRCSRGHYVYGCFEMLGALFAAGISTSKGVYFNINLTSPRILIPSCTSCIQPLSSSSRAVIGLSGDEERRP
jgi:hypothetical protein